MQPDRWFDLPWNDRHSVGLNFLDFDTDSRAVLAQLGRRARHVDEVARGATLPVSRAQAVLLRLLLRGVVEDRGAGRYVLAAPPA